MRISDWSSDVCSSDLILAHPIDRETEIEFALRHRPPAVQHLPACRRAARYRFEHLVGVEAGYLGKAQRLGHALDDAGDRDLVDQLGRLAGAAAADMDAAPRIGAHTRRRGSKGARAAAPNDRQPPRPRTPFPAANPRVTAPPTP